MTLTDSPATAPPERAPDQPAVAPPDGGWAGRARARVRRPTGSGWIVAAIAALALVLYTWSLSSVGWANSYYAAAVKSATTSWKAFFFGSIDPGNFITVDKPPAAFWVQALSARIFGFSAWSILLPEALAGVGSVLILHRLVRRWAGDVAAHLAALGVALTPVAVAMFRYNNPDAFLTFLLLAAAWALWAAVETGRTRHLVVAAALVGLAFDTKMLQAALVLPAFVAVYLVAGPPKLGRRIAQLAIAAATLVVSAGWWVAIVALWPASSRPFIGSTSDNSILSLIFGYNGLSRLFGDGGGGPGGGAGPGGGGPGGGAGFGGASGWSRMFNSAVGGQVSWLLPLALVGLAGGLWATRRGARTDRARAGWLLWGGWTLVTMAVFSLSKGIFHQYYTVALAPGVAALAGAGAVGLWRLGRTSAWLRWALPATVAATAVWAVVLLHRTPGYDTWLVPAVTAGAALGGAGLWAAFHLRSRALLAGAAALATVSLLAGPAAYAVTTIRSPGGGPLASAGPSTGGASGRGGAGFGPGGAALGPGGAGLGPGGAGPGASRATDAGLISYLQANRGSARYLVAAFGSQASAPIIIATGQPVVTIGGFNGGDPAPTLAQFTALVASGQLRYVLVGGGGGPGGGGPGMGGGPGGSGSAITTWVTTNAKVVPASSYGGSTGSGTLYDLSGTA